MPDSLNSGKRELSQKIGEAANSGFDLAALIRSAQKQMRGEGLPPVDSWEPEYCGEMDMVIKTDGSWWHEGSPITREPLIKLFASILRRDEDGQTYLVTPVEKIAIDVERAHFLAVRVDIEGDGLQQRVFFTTNMGDIVQLGPQRPLHVETDTKTLEPYPYIIVRGRLEAMLTRPVFYELVERAIEIEQANGRQLGIYGDRQFFPLGPVGIHER